MENPGILNWRTWSIVRKAQIIGALLGSFGTVGFSLVLGVFNDPHQMFNFPFVIHFLICLPTWILLRFIGRESVMVGNSDHWPLVALLLMGLVNAILLFVLGTLAGWILQRYKNRRKTAVTLPP